MTSAAAYRGLDVGLAELREGRVSEDVLARYSRDPLAHLDDGHVKILDLVTLEEVTFHAFPHQREVAATWMDLKLLARTGRLAYRNVVEEKSRQMGLTWMLAWLEVWALTYHGGGGLALHMDFGEVDDGGAGSTVDSLFGKARFMHERMPMQYRAPLTFKSGSIRNDFTGGFCTAEGAGPDPGRGGRYRRVLIDEAARIAFGEAAHSALSRACPRGRFYNSTPKGKGNVFFRLRETRPQGYRFLRHHWSEHPVYAEGLHVAGRDPDCAMCEGNRTAIPWTAERPRAHRYPGKPTSPWYDEAVLDLTDEQVASELDIDYEASASARVYPEFSATMHVASRVLTFDHRLGPPELAFDYGLDTTSVLVMQDGPEELRIIGEVELHFNAVPDAVVPELLIELRRCGAGDYAEPDTLPLIRAIGDPAGEQRQQGTGRTIVAEYRRLGLNIEARRMPLGSTLIAVKRLLNGRPKRLTVSPACPHFIEHIENNHYPTDREGRRRIGANEPLNDQHNHMMRAFAYYASVKWPPGSIEAGLRKATADEAVVEAARAREDRGGIGYDTRL